MSDVAALVADNLDIWTGTIERKSGAGRGGGGKRISLYGIERLRALILDLAVRGKLVAQESGDEPATELLRKISKERAASKQVGKNMKAANGKQIAPSSRAETPEGWAIVRLADVILGNVGGGTPSKAEPSFWGGNIPWASVKDVGKSKYVSDTQDRITELGLAKSAANLVPAGNIILVTRMGLGQLSINTIDLAINQDLRAIFLSEHVDIDYCYNYFLTCEMEGTGMTVKGIKLDDLLGLPFPLPPLAEQRRIVAKVDELMALCDALERRSADALAAHQVLVATLLATLVNSADALDLAANWARLESHFDTLFTTEASIDTLKQTILDLAVRGKVVEQDAANWPVEPLGKYVKDAAAGWSPKCIETPRSGDNWGVLKVSAVTWGRFQPDENKELPPSLEPRPEIEVVPGDFLISRANTAELVARSVVVPLNTPSKLMMSDKIIRFRFNDKIDPEYVNLVHASPFARAYYGRVAGGTSSSMKNVSQALIRALEIPIPPLAEQHRIVAKVDELMALCDALKARLSDAAETRRHLADAIVERAAA